MQTVLDAWSRWQVSFLGFCKHVREELRVPFGRDMFARILEVHGLRRRATRDGRSPDESALRGALRTFFPGAQWVGDGMQVPVVVDSQRFTFDFELDVDAHTGAFAGVSVRREEDAAAVVEAFRDGILTTRSAPLAILLDNRPSNHTPEVGLALGDMIRIRATPERPQNKAHVEGAFGLFSQVLPDLLLDTRGGAYALAAAIVGVVVQVWARTTKSPTSCRPRRPLACRSLLRLAVRRADRAVRRADRAGLSRAARDRRAPGAGQTHARGPLPP